MANNTAHRANVGLVMVEIVSLLNMILQIAAELAYITLCGFHAMYRPAKLPNILLEIWRPGIDCSRHAAAPECSAKGA